LADGLGTGASTGPVREEERGRTKGASVCEQVSVHQHDLIQRLWRDVSELHALRERELAAMAAQKKAESVAPHEELARFRQRVRELEAQLEAVYASETFRVGKAMLSVPRRVMLRSAQRS
jgi:hypothetical protein